MSNQVTFLSTKDIPSNERLIVALDMPDAERAQRLVSDLGDSVGFYKLGLELFLAAGYFELLDWLKEKEKTVLVDLKFFDVPRTVGAAIVQLRGRGADFATVHGNDEILRAAVEERDGTKILAVTVLTSLDQCDIEDLGFHTDITRLVLSRARRALELDCDGVISSGLESLALRDELGDNFLIVVPGIRPAANVDDQKRTVDVEEAFRNGADYIVVGRPIHEAKKPREAAEAIQERIARLFSV